MRTNRLMQNAERNRSDGDYLITYVPAACSCGRDVCAYECVKIDTFIQKTCGCVARACVYEINFVSLQREIEIRSYKRFNKFY